MIRFAASILTFMFLFILMAGCVAKFVPETNEEEELLVVQGLITDQWETDTIKLSKSMPLGQNDAPEPVSGSEVFITDNQGGYASLNESFPGTYLTPSYFHASPGLLYTLHIRYNNRNYESYPAEMIQVPPIDSLYYEKISVEKPFGFFKGVDECQIYLNTHDPENRCKFYRWDFSETWILRLLFPVENMICWITESSREINIKSTAVFNESRVDRLPLKYISRNTDRLKTRYSILVNQYSLNEDEFNYWEKIRKVAVQVGGLYDLIPASVPGNMKCIEDPAERVLGYFSVSAKTSKRIYIQDTFPGIINMYNDCPTDTIPYVDPPGLGISVWILYDSRYSIPPFRILTEQKGCADCTVRGSKIKPAFWEDN